MSIFTADHDFSCFGEYIPIDLFQADMPKKFNIPSVDMKSKKIISVSLDSVFVLTVIPKEARE